MMICFVQKKKSEIFYHVMFSVSKIGMSNKKVATSQ